jgi:hypothetical protein
MLSYGVHYGLIFINIFSVWVWEGDEEDFSRTITSSEKGISEN